MIGSRTLAGAVTPPSKCFPFYVPVGTWCMHVRTCQTWNVTTHTFTQSHKLRGSRSYQPDVIRDHLLLVYCSTVCQWSCVPTPGIKSPRVPHSHIVITRHLCQHRGTLWHAHTGCVKGNAFWNRGLGAAAASVDRQSGPFSLARCTPASHAAVYSLNSLFLPPCPVTTRDSAWSPSQRVHLYPFVRDDDFIPVGLSAARHFTLLPAHFLFIFIQH